MNSRCFSSRKLELLLGQGLLEELLLGLMKNKERSVFRLIAYVVDRYLPAAVCAMRLDIVLYSGDDSVYANLTGASFFIDPSIFY